MRRPTNPTPGEVPQAFFQIAPSILFCQRPSMSIASATNRAQYPITAASSAPLTIPFRYDEASWLMVFYVADGSQEAVTLVNGADFSLSGDGEAVEGTLTLDAGFLSGVTGGALTISRFTPALQDLNLQYNNRLPAELLERALDRATMEIQDRDVNPGGLGSRAVMFPLTEPAGNSNILDIPQNRVNKFWAGNAEGKMGFINAQEAAQILLGYLGNPPTTAEYLAAVSAIQPIRLMAPPTENTPAQGGQFAFIPYIPVGVRAFGASDPKWNKYLLYSGILGDRPSYSDTGSNINPKDSLSATGGGLNIWLYSVDNGLGSYSQALAFDSASSPPEITADWIADGEFLIEGLEFENVSDVPGRLWYNSSDTGKPPVWVEIITENSFLSLPTTDPGVLGKLFRTGTALQVSQG